MLSKILKLLLVLIYFLIPFEMTRQLILLLTVFSSLIVAHAQTDSASQIFNLFAPR